MAQPAAGLELFAPCGMNCSLCYRHLGKKPCGGCRGGEEEKPASCRSCGVRDCALERGLAYCFQCGEFPCKRLRALDKSYRTRYGVSLAAFGRDAGQKGVAAVMEEQAARYTCGDCGGIICLHDGICSRCKRQHQMGRGKRL